MIERGFQIVPLKDIKPPVKKEREEKCLTIKCQHGGEIFAVGDAG